MCYVPTKYFQLTSTNPKYFILEGQKRYYYGKTTISHTVFLVSMEILLDLEMLLATKKYDLQKNLLLQIKVSKILCICCNLHPFPETAKWTRCLRETFSSLA